MQFLVDANEGTDPCPVMKLIDLKLGRQSRLGRQSLEFVFCLTQMNNPNSPKFLIIRVLVVKLMMCQAAFSFHYFI